jgi:hypothetical protein
MGKLILGIVVLAVAIGSARATAQQCITFSSTVPCVAKDGPIDRVQFGDAKPAPSKQVKVVPAPTIETKPHPHQAIDCAMLKYVDPNFRSKMPVIKTDDPKVKQTMRVVIPTPCK